MSGNVSIIVINQDGICKPKAPDRIGNLLYLTFGMRAGITRRTSQIDYLDVLN